MKFTVVRDGVHPLRDRLADELVSIFVAYGHDLCEDGEESLRMILNLTDANQPRPYRRRSRAVYVWSPSWPPIACRRTPHEWCIPFWCALSPTWPSTPSAT
ncbi:MAG: hypothetical protein U9Q78_00980 [Chloroflexota bacterium]|nr:hypothetical protein [Chloroflexota bacterium]